MDKAMEHFKERLEIATATNGPDGIPFATAIAIDSKGMYVQHLSTLLSEVFLPGVD
jgi:hypothetical protein